MGLAALTRLEDARIAGGAVPLAKKLGLAAPLTLLTVGAPAEYPTWLGELPLGVRLTSRRSGTVRGAHLFVVRRAEMKKRLAALRAALESTGFVWVSWPKKASKVETDITDHAVREVARPMGFVDIKVCAVSDVWSGLKLVVRKSARPSVGAGMCGRR